MISSYRRLISSMAAALTGEAAPLRAGTARGPVMASMGPPLGATGCRCFILFSTLHVIFGKPSLALAKITQSFSRPT